MPPFRPGVGSVPAPLSTIFEPNPGIQQSRWATGSLERHVLQRIQIDRAKMEFIFFARGNGDFAVVPKDDLALVFKYIYPTSFTKNSAASAFTRTELQASNLKMCWRCAFSTADTELSPKKPVWFFKGDTLKLGVNSVVRVV